MSVKGMMQTVLVAELKQIQPDISNEALQYVVDNFSQVFDVREILAEENQELTQSNKSFVSALQKAEAYNVQLENERDALAAQVAAYKERSSELYKLSDELIDHLRYNKAERDEVLNKFWDKQEAIKHITSDPHQCLAEIRAEAVNGLAIYICDRAFKEAVFKSEVIKLASEYAAKVRQGGE